MYIEDVFEFLSPMNFFPGVGLGVGCCLTTGYFCADMDVYAGICKQEHITEHVPPKP